MQPNVLIFCTDEQRADHLGCMGHSRLKTPHIDRIAAEGTLFRNCYTSSPVCMPARATMFTGLTNRATGVRCNGISLPENIPTLPGLLAAAGYRTHAVGKLHLKTWGTPRGFDVIEVETPEQNPERRIFWNRGLIRKSPPNYYGFQTQDSAHGHVNYINGDYKTWLDEEHPGAYEGYACSNKNPRPLEIDPSLHYNTWIADRSIEFIEQQKDSDSPWFLWCSFPDPHEPFAAVRKWSDIYGDIGIELSQSSVEVVSADNSETLGAIGLAPKQHDLAYIRACLRQTYGMISHVDEQVGRVLDTLDRVGATDNTVVIFVSDHGDQLGEHGLFYKGLYPYDGHSRIPFVARVPWSSAKGRVVDDVVSLLDLVPTVLDLTGVDQPDDQRVTAAWREGAHVAPSLPGEVLTPVLTRGARPARCSALIELDEDRYEAFDTVQMRALVTNEHKIVFYAPTNEVMLFDRARDPDEMKNVAGDPKYQTVLNDMVRRLLFELTRTEPRRPRQFCGA
jgi:arylsulfatase A-like enzyme